MKFEDYQSGVWQQQYHYKSFLPSLVNHEWNWENPQINVLLERAVRALGELNAYTKIVPDVNLFIQMHIVTEANCSSRIEGTRTKIEEDVLSADDISPEKRDDWQEVQNYVAAMNRAVASLENLPLSFRLLCDTHGILLQSGRGINRSPGKPRTSQNWIGGASIADATFIPPHHTEMPPLISDLESFWHNDAIDVPDLIRAAISHYQFETIHPFLDGNGRIGRLLIPLYLIDKKLLDKPSLYISAYFERNRVAYYDALTRVRVTNNIGAWCRFFLQAVIDTATRGKQTFERILALKHELDTTLATLGRRAENARMLLLELYKKPVITISQVETLLDIKRNPARHLIQELQNAQILDEITGYKRNRIFMFRRYLELFHEPSPDSTAPHDSLSEA